jgi:hypothetical protein
MKSAILEISPEMFQTVFQLPTDAKVVGVLTDIAELTGPRVGHRSNE